ncbi:Uncharacterized conserved protein, contains JmjC domain [Ceraceosorus bombacis]|uniref:Uncharacterized conserved protein, contains JmjC domain n=1 Tax=Ceraceosorus bombacis TaxID=401625 RepID=A0A0P1BQV2_9BASI|nr:Uncharacterized conserved protein, contains JmjC domain [Ceraceosorus bombacis]
MLRSDAAREATVKVELAKFGRGYNDEGKGWDLIRMPFGTFIESFICQSLPWSSTTERLVGYVAQQPLADLGQELDADCPSLPHVKQGAKGGGEDWGRNIWVGGAGTFTPIHRDPYHNLFVQVVGHKRIHFFPPEAADLLHLNRTGTQTNTSRVASEAALLNGIPKDCTETDSLSLAQAIHKHALKAAHVVLEPGDALYIPQGWFHCVASLSTSASVNSWFR